MKRRDFLEKSALLSTAAFLPFRGISSAREPQYKMGLQLYSVHQDMINDTTGTLAAVKEMGYEDFETFGFDPAKGTFYGISASDFKATLDDLGLSASSGHFGFSSILRGSVDDRKRFTNACIAGAKSLNLKYITWPWMAPEQRTLETFQKLPDMLNAIGEQITQAGLGFAYHNHGFEFVDYDGKTGYDIILRETDPELVKLQMDMYWVMHSSKFTPKQLVALQPGRFVMWHIKDMDKVSRDYTELGNGRINYKEVLPDPKQSGLEYYYLEQGGNFATSPLVSVADSARYFQEHLQQYL
ncbi:MAG: TIM barrel protein [Marinoscillum sp.]